MVRQELSRTRLLRSLADPKGGMLRAWSDFPPSRHLLTTYLPDILDSGPCVFAFLALFGAIERSKPE